MTIPQFGRYEILREIGRGGMATIYLASDPLFDRQVAIKVLPKYFLHEQGFQKRFRREAQTIASLEHRAIVPVYDYGEEDEQPYLVMRFMLGGSLRDRLQNGPIDFQAAKSICLEIASALVVAHQKGIVHRDLKPDNILFDEFDNPYLSDFGIAKLIAQTQTFTQGIIGTPQYMSPEQWRAKEELDGRCDQYALGIILYQMLTGDLPFDAKETTGMMLAHVNDPIPDITLKMPASPEGIGRFFKKTVAKNRNDRYPDMSSWITELFKLGDDTAETGEDISPTNKIASETIIMEDLIDSMIEDPRSVIRESHSSKRNLTPSPHDSGNSSLFGQPEKESGFPVWGWGAIGGTLIAITLLTYFIFGFGGEGSNGSGGPEENNPGQPIAVGDLSTDTPTPIPLTATATVTPQPTATQTMTPTPIPTDTPMPTPIPTVLPPANAFGIEWIEIPAGSFLMGANETDSEALEIEKPLHTVELDRYWITKHEITNAQYQLFIDANPEHPVPFVDANWAETHNWDPDTRTFVEGREDFPVILVSWIDAMAFAEWFGEQIGSQVLLPSEAEWEKAARGDGEPLIFPWGNEFDESRVSYTGNRFNFGAYPVGSFENGQSVYGVEDLVGGVWEWTRSGFADSYPYQPELETIEYIPEELRVRRGGSWFSEEQEVRLSTRRAEPPETQFPDLGFRLVVLNVPKQ